VLPPPLVNWKPQQRALTAPQYMKFGYRREWYFSCCILVCMICIFLQ
jgi:hypothetical protein